jgi:hypothetical protein
MRKLVVAITLVGAFAGSSLISHSARALDNCYVVRATANARNERISRDRAQSRLQHYIARNLSSMHGKSLSPVSTHCIRNACEASAIVCHH